MIKTRRTALAVSSIALLAMPSVSLYSQEESEEVFNISPFVVDGSKDQGYRANSTLAGSRLNTSLADTPVALSVMTDQYIKDIGADNINEAIGYGLNAGNDIGGGGTNAGAVTGNGLVGSEYNFQVRGYRNAAATRDYFSTLIASDSFNIERIEIARGPNSLIFGVGGPGGIINTQVKRASTETEFTNLGVKVGDYGLMRYTLDTNQAFLDNKLGVRFNYLNQQKDGWKDFARDDQERFALAATARLSENTEIRFTGEAGVLNQNRVRPWAPLDGVGQWEWNGSHYFDYGTPESPWEAGDDNYTQKRDNLPQAGYWGFGVNPDSNGLPDYLTPGNPDDFERRSHHLGTPNILMTTGPLAGKFIHVGGREEGGRYYRVSGGPVNVFDTPTFYHDESVAPRRANPVGPGANQYNDYQTLGFSIDHRIGQNLNLNLTANDSTNERQNKNVVGFNEIKYNLDIMSTLPTFNNDGSYNAELAPPHGERGEPGAGKGTLIFDSLINNPMLNKTLVLANPSYTNLEETQEDIRLSANYKIEPGDKWGTHNLMAFAQKSTTGRFSEGYRETNVSPNRPRNDRWFDSANYPGRAVHVDYMSPNLSERGVPDPWENPLPSSILWGEDPSLGYAFQPGWIRNSMSRSEFEIESTAIALQSKLLNDSLVTTLGARRDDVSISNWGRVNDDLGEVTGLEAPSFAQTESGDTYSIGFVYDIPGVDWLSIFANKSTNFQTQAGAQRFEDRDLRTDMEIGALEGTGEDFGVKVNLNEKVYATLAYYKVSQDNAVGGGFTSNVVNYINAIWTTIDNNAAGRTDPSDPLWETDTENPNGHQVGGAETKSQVSDGIELEIVANPTENWRISFNYSDADNVVSNLGTGLDAYMSKHIDTWNANAGLTYDFDSSPGFLGDNTVGDLVNGLQEFLTYKQAGEGVGEVNYRPESANLFTAYTFNDGAFEGLTLGGGFNYRGDAILGIDPGSVDSPEPRTFWGGAYTTYSAMASYEFTVSEKVDVRLQMNISNALDNDDLQVLGSQYNPNSDSLDTYFYYLDPRTYTFSANFLF
ncbi:TonB-dependent receptor plug domain-containing protein [Pelagicoccus sp. SDUM812002]|uniref:TonB-dependent siderophore receptor n=1 Tax=Pelagicoccus sp. SDUM812002 TaxID=3041266 RepID=UPI00280FEA1D|nr:TonB-dependent receptor plug domain-containing protein [Pelagicoccus sp. SDUM812002]MDQ8186543.1 TonB-dependent receptor plug domain-containing protein [Pelagicoccus sp. SDUM812002]